MAKVRIYSTATCGYCKMEKAYLDEQGVAYEDIMVDQDPARAKEMIELSGQMGVPFTVISKDNGTEEHILGFDQPKLNAALGLAASR
ncbi:glutaredoxin family protein [Candidatus Parcubacteria bacterium]|nr:glutaredoxin family protein [Candidatus Parcubacteria bacterium]